MLKKMCLQMKKKNKGFTLIELIVVIAILGILAAVLIPTFTGFQDKARSSQVLVEVKQVATAADGLLIENDGTLPTAGEIVTVAGSDITAANITNIADGGNGHVTFDYDITVGTTAFSATRNADGTIDITW